MIGLEFVLNISTDNSTFEFKGSHEDILKQLNSMATVYNMTKMVNISAVARDKVYIPFFNSHFKGDNNVISKETQLNSLLRFPEPVNEYIAIIGCLQTELGCLRNDVAVTKSTVNVFCKHFRNCPKNHKCDGCELACAESSGEVNNLDINFSCLYYGKCPSGHKCRGCLHNTNSASTEGIGVNNGSAFR